MSVLVSIGDFSRMTHLSIKALRFYHDQGLLEPARIDPFTGYRFYEPGQVPVAQVIRRFRDLDMPLDQVRAVLYLQQGHGLSPLAAGGVFTFLAAGYLLTSFRAPALTMRFGRSVIAAGAVTAALGDAALYLATAHAGTSGSVAWLFPGLLLLGAGQGLCITPLTTTVLSHADPATAGSVSGALSTAQQVGNSVGVAVSGVLFFGALSHGYGLAFERSVLQMGALLLVVAALTRLMPGRRATA